MVDGAPGNVEACRAQREKKGLEKVIRQIQTKWITPENYHEIIPEGEGDQ